MRDRCYGTFEDFNLNFPYLFPSSFSIVFASYNFLIIFLFEKLSRKKKMSLECTIIW